ncbi:OmpA family protein [Trebonia sp.]|uniref:OmpA family protein n=1 Tax=Trebonia sp. TaxID=2767075 RepID=UPI00263A3461|nr:OmpA family protein [Trebonia sp.]
MRYSWILAAAAATVVLSGCGSISDLTSTAATTAQTCPHPDGMILVIGAHRDVPAPQLDPLLECELTAVIGTGGPVRILIPDSPPQLITPQLEPVNGGTLAQQASPRVQHDVQLTDQAVSNARPDAPGVDDLNALAVAADEADTLGGTGIEIVLIDSGLDDRGALNFTVPGLLAATPAEVVSQLRATGNLPELHRLTVVLVGLGYTAPPQAPLSAKWRASLTAIWRAVVSAAGARVRIIPQPGLSASVVTDEPVRLVPVPSAGYIHPAAGQTIVFSGISAVRFQPNSTAFVDQVAAIEALAPIAHWLAADPARHAELEGTTADVGPMSGQVELSLLRADRVKAALISLGAQPTQITTTGVGSDFPQFAPDRDADGALLAGPATLNRSVRITLS